MPFSSTESIVHLASVSGFPWKVLLWTLECVALIFPSSSPVQCCLPLPVHFPMSRILISLAPHLTWLTLALFLGYSPDLTFSGRPIPGYSPLLYAPSTMLVQLFNSFLVSFSYAPLEVCSTETGVFICLVQGCNTMLRTMPGAYTGILIFIYWTNELMTHVYSTFIWLFIKQAG